MKNDEIKDRILYEDNHLIAINKLNCEPVQSDESGDESLLDKVKNFIKVRDKKPGNVFLGLIHRIDRPTSGIVLFAKTSKGLSRMNELFQSRDLSKIYYVVVENQPPEEEGMISCYLRKNESKNKSFCFDEQVKNSKLAQLKYKLIGCVNNFYLVEVNLMSGRHHQIRAQFASLGMPVKADVKYGAEEAAKDGSIFLHAARVEFIHPVTKDKIVIKADPPKNQIWSLFSFI